MRSNSPPQVQRKRRELESLLSAPPLSLRSLCVGEHQLSKRPFLIEPLFQGSYYRKRGLYLHKPCAYCCTEVSHRKRREVDDPRRKAKTDRAVCRWILRSGEKPGRISR